MFKLITPNAPLPLPAITYTPSTTMQRLINQSLANP